MKHPLGMMLTVGVALLMMTLTATAQVAAAPQPIVLWPQGAPGAVGAEDVDRPTLTAFQPTAEQRVPSAVIVCPGGGYGFLASDYEGSEVAQWLSARGVSGFVLKYRLAPRYRFPAPLEDAQRAIRYIRAHAAELGVAPDRIGIWGFSAGGHLAAMTGTRFDEGTPGAKDPLDRVSCRPDFMILAYPVISLTAPYAHLGSRDNLLGPHFDPKLALSLSEDTQVTARTPPTFLFSTDADTLVPAENSIAFYLALRKNKVPAEIHVYEHGQHGVGLALLDPVLSSWPARLSDWLKGRGLLDR